jgi:tetratricopeptide (TPR) repeat protein
VVRLVVLVFLLLGLLTGCSILPNGVSNGERHDPRSQQSLEVQRGESSGYGQQDDILRLDEGDHHPAVQVLLTQAEQARQQDDQQQALAYLDRARQIQPRNSAIFYRQAWLNFQLGELEQAQQLLQRARLFLRSSNASHKILQRRIDALQNKVDAKLGY